MALIIDTSVLIAAERGRFDLDGFLTQAGDVAVAISAVTASELLHGVDRAHTARAHSARSQFVDDILDAFPVIPFGLAEARVHSRLWAQLTKSGKTIGAHDLFVAATAVSLGSSVATLNRKEFTRVPGLALEPMESWGR